MGHRNQERDQAAAVLRVLQGAYQWPADLVWHVVNECCLLLWNAWKYVENVSVSERWMQGHGVTGLTQGLSLTLRQLCGPPGFMCPRSSTMNFVLLDLDWRVFQRFVAEVCCMHHGRSHRLVLQAGARYRCGFYKQTLQTFMLSPVERSDSVMCKGSSGLHCILGGRGGVAGSPHSFLGLLEPPSFPSAWGCSCIHTGLL